MADKKIKIDVVVDPSKAKAGIKAVEGDLDNLGTAGGKTGGLFSGIGDKIKGVFGKGGPASSAVGSLGGDVGALGGAFTGPQVAVAATGAAIAKFALDGAAKFAALGEKVETFKGISGTTAQEASKWVAVADDYGVSAEELAGSFGKLGKVLGTNAAALDEYGVVVARAKDGSVDLNATAMNVIDTYNHTVDPTIKAKLATEAFGKSYTALVPLIDEGSTKILDRMKQVDGAQLFTDDKLKKAEDYRLAMDNLHDTLNDLQMELGEKLIPTIVNMSESVTVLSNSFSFLSDHIPTQVLESLKVLLDPVGHGIGALKDQADKLTDTFTHFDEKAKPFDKWMVRQLDFLPSFAGEAQVVVSGMGDLSSSTTEAASAQEQLYLAMLDSKAASVKATEAGKKQVDVSDQLIKRYQDEKQAILDRASALNDSTDKALASQSADLASADALDAYTKSLGDSTLTARDQQQVFIDTQKTINNGAATFADYVVGQVKGTGQILSAADEARIRTDAQITSLEHERDSLKEGSPLWNAIEAHIEHLKAIPTSVVTNVDTTISGNAAGGVKGKKAAGGPVSAGGVYLVGEKGPELFNPGSSGTIIPNNRLGGPGGVGGSVFNITINVPPATDAGKYIVEQIAKFERANGANWRAAS